MIKKIIILAVTIFIWPQFAYSFPHDNQQYNTLESIQKYAAAHPENVQSDNNDWVDPEFITFYKKNYSFSWLDRLIRFLSLKKQPRWNAKTFRSLIEKITRERTSQKKQTPHFKTIQVTPKNRLFLFGDLQGAFHSMVRDLKYLQTLQVINNSLEIQDKNTYIVIIGDAISRSPYSLELMSIILLLMDKNPDNFIYLKGNHEKNNYWENFSMERELQFKAANISNHQGNKAPLTKQINNFFKTLPDTLIIENIYRPKEKISISHSKIGKDAILDPGLKFAIVGEKRLEVVKKTKGLEFIGYDKGTAKWSVISCPTSVYQKFFNLHYDALTEITFDKKFNHSIITLHSHNITEKNNTYTKTHYDPIFAFPLTEKKSITQSKKIVKVGSSMYLTGVNWDLGKEIKSGLETAIYHYNQQKPHTLIRPYFLDDGYNPRKTYLNINILKQAYGIDKILMPTGTPTLAIYLDQVKNGEISVFFPATGATTYRTPEIKNIIHLRATYIQEAKILLRYLIKEYGIKRFAFFYQTYGQPIADAMHEELKKHGITEWLDLPHSKTQENFGGVGGIKQKIKRFTPEAIGCFSSQLPTQRLINTLGTDFFLKHLLFIPPSLYTINFKKFLQTRGIKYVMVSMLPAPNKANIKIAKEHLEAMQSRGLTSTIHSLSGYIAGSLFADAVNKITPPVTKEKLLSHFENIKNYQFKGVDITFNPQTRSLTKDIWIKSSENTWQKQKQ